jgi:hypothetical protein
MATGIDIFPVLQACILLSWYFYMDGRWVEVMRVDLIKSSVGLTLCQVWVFAGFQTRVAIPLRLNYPGTFTVQSRNAPGAYLAPPKDVRELELRRRTWWMAVMFDRIVSMGGWVHGIDERDIGTEFPLRTEDFHAEVIPPPHCQMTQAQYFDSAKFLATLRTWSRKISLRPIRLPIPTHSSCSSRQ